MRLLLVVLVAVIGILLWRMRGPFRSTARPTQPPRDDRQTDDMLSCAHCALHIPRAEAFPGERGSYCSAQHRQLSES